MKLNRSGFTLVEVLAVIVILSVILAIIIPGVNGLINKNKEYNLEHLKNSVIVAAKNYFSDYRYDIKLDGTCGSNQGTINVKEINKVELDNSKLEIQTLISNEYLKGEIKNPITGEVLSDGNILVKFDCSTRDYVFELIGDFWNVS